MFYLRSINTVAPPLPLYLLDVALSHDGRPRPRIRTLRIIHCLLVPLKLEELRLPVLRELLKGIGGDGDRRREVLGVVLGECIYEGDEAVERMVCTEWGGRGAYGLKNDGVVDILVVTPLTGDVIKRDHIILVERKLDRNERSNLGRSERVSGRRRLLKNAGVGYNVTRRRRGVNDLRLLLATIIVVKHGERAEVALVARNLLPLRRLGHLNTVVLGDDMRLILHCLRLLAVLRLDLGAVLHGMTASLTVAADRCDEHGAHHLTGGVGGLANIVAGVLLRALAHVLTDLTELTPTDLRPGVGVAVPGLGVLGDGRHCYLQMYVSY